MSRSESSVFTLSERTDKKYTIGQAVASAKRRLVNAGINEMCMNAVSLGCDLKTPITLEKLNQISDAIYDDTTYHYTGQIRRPLRR
jgi:alpha-D-ribose 1-methylphosphonate 5-triphosphate diphosphatase PhnM